MGEPLCMMLELSSVSGNSGVTFCVRGYLLCPGLLSVSGNCLPGLSGLSGLCPMMELPSLPRDGAASVSWDGVTLCAQ